jgi:NADH dehydrogenase
VDDLAQLAVEQGMQSHNAIINAIGPETFTYRELIEAIGKIIGKNRPIVSVPPSVAYAAGWVIGKLMGDVMISREEIRGLMDGLLCVDALPAGTTKLTDWARERSTSLGLHYTNELARRQDRSAEYKSN